MRTIQVKRGTAANTPTLADGELGLQTDAGKLLVGNRGENLPVAMDADLAAVKTEMAGKAPTNHTHTAEQVGARPINWTPSKADVGLGNVDNTADSVKSVNYANTSGNTNAVGGRASSTVLSEIDNLKTSVANGKSQIASAISDKGVSTGADADFGTMANNIRAIKTGPNYIDFQLRADASSNASATNASNDLNGYQSSLGRPIAFDILGLYTNKEVTYTNRERNRLHLSDSTLAFTFYYNQPSDAISAIAVVRVYFENLQFSSITSSYTINKSIECELRPTEYTVDASRF